MRRFYFLFVGLSILFSGCSLMKPDESKINALRRQLDTIMVSDADYKSHPYHATPEKAMDLIHTKLDVTPDWEKQYLYGQATLTFSPYYYPQDSLVVDAKGFELETVALQKANGREALSYTYDSQKLNIELPETYKRNDTFKIFIDYTAKPEELNQNEYGIAGNQGLYFINPTGKIKGKPRQIWTQGETEYSSCWFPTLDRPNEKTTQEIYITVDTGLKTLSNGQKIYSMLNAGGTRTDYWRQNKPHAPYLFMMAIGDFAVVKDQWRDTLPVNYYVEPRYEKYADMIFGKTPEMIEYYSQVLDYDYPWGKYSQVAVRDFIAGAMENTSATIHFQGIQQNRREHLDQTYESLIAHELIHHWFGDLVTCEAWSNLALNEAFATYGEHMWKEHEYGEAAAAVEWQNDFRRYLYEFHRKNVPLIQYRYESSSNLFDAHRYQKGACILKMLRAYLGDDAFFDGLSHYLHTYEYEPVEYHQLRLALEEVSGKDLKWFFDQWFRSLGHPDLTINTKYDTSGNAVEMIVRQRQNPDKFPTFKLPVKVDIYQSDDVTRKSIWVDEREDTFRFAAQTPPEVVNFDAEKVLLAEKSFDKTPAEWLYQYRNAPLYLDRYEAVAAISNNSDSLSLAKRKSVISEFINDDHWRIRNLALEMVEDFEAKSRQVNFRGAVVKLAKNDPESKVRRRAFEALGEYERGDSVIEAFKTGLKDSSYQVVMEALGGLTALDKKLALEMAEPLKDTRSDQLLFKVAKLYADYGGEGVNSYLQSLLVEKQNWNRRFAFVDDYLMYLDRMGDAFFLDNLEVFNRLEAWIAGPNDRKTMVQTLKSFRNQKQQNVEDAERTTGTGEAGDMPKHDDRENLTTSLVDKLNELIENLEH